MSGRGRTTQRLRALASERFRACEACSDESDSILEQVLSPLNLTGPERRRLYQHLTCPNCESYLRGSCWVSPYTAQEFRGNRRWQVFLREHTDQFASFHTFISDYPGLGGLHPFGHRVAGAMKRAKLTMLEPDTWYRAVPYEDDGKLPAPEHFLPADPRRRARLAARFNYAGQLGYYLASSREAAAAEVLKRSDEVARLHDRDSRITASDVARDLMIQVDEAKRLLERRIECKDAVGIRSMRVLRPLKVLDIRGQAFGARNLQSRMLEALVNMGSLREPTSPDDRSCPQYRVPQFIADLARSRGLDGILYGSSCQDYGYNLVVFRTPHGTVEPASDPVGYRWRGVPSASAMDIVLMDLAPAHLYELP